MTITKYGVLIGSVAILVVQGANAQLDVGNNVDACTQIDGLRKANKLSEARDAARTCLDALEQEVNGAAGKFFLPEVAGWKKTNIDQSQALGFTNISATYAKGEKTATVSLTGGSGGGGALGGLLGGFAKLGVQSSGKQVKVAGLPANVGPDGAITVTLKDGSFLGFSSPDFRDPDAALAGIGDLVNAFPVAEINKTLQ